ncbi:MAG: DUF4097 family beta strand repeat protein [Candidatus Zixiibacteriota bacterium]|nr:MAG: DUF4097 family beta strand repeat protein [candidate division Zixibacteria bacterium]
MKLRYILLFCALFILATSTVMPVDLYQLEKNRFVTKEESLELPLDPGSRVIISSAVHLSGELKVTTEKAEGILFEYKKILKVGSESEAADYAALIDVDIMRTSDGVKLLLQAPNPAPWAGTDDAGMIEAELHLPGDCDVEVYADYFDVTMVGPFRSVENRSALGRQEIQNVTERLAVSGSGRDIRLKDIRGNISVGSNNADIRIENMISETKPAHISNENGDIIMEAVRGAFTIDGSYGKIRIDGAELKGGISRITGSQCPIRLTIRDMTESALTIADDYEDVELYVNKAVSAVFSLQVESGGEVHVTRIPVRPITVASNYLEFVTGKGGPAIDIDVGGGGNIRIKGIR